MAKERPDRPGKTPFVIEMPTTDYERLKAFAAKRGSTMKAEILAAVRRHMASPPPLPDAVPLPPPRPRGRPKKNLENKSPK